MTDDSNRQSYPWIPVAGGILCIISGALGLLSRLALLLLSSLLALHISGPAFRILSIIFSFSVIFDILAVVGGVFALRRRNRGLSLAGAISTLLAGSWLFGSLSTVFISLSRKDFE